MSTKTPREKYVFDGCGINGPDEYRSRVATFTPLGQIYAKDVARRITLHDELSGALRDLLATALSRGAKLGLDAGGPVLDKARAVLAKLEEVSP